MSHYPVHLYFKGGMIDGTVYTYQQVYSRMFKDYQSYLPQQEDLQFIVLCWRNGHAPARVCTEALVRLLESRAYGATTVDGVAHWLMNRLVIKRRKSKKLGK
jgi:hypothetical protein